jgi:hypothetical protein
MTLTEALNVNGCAKIVCGGAELRIIAMRNSNYSGDAAIQIIHPTGTIEETRATSPEDVHACIGRFFRVYGEWKP